MIRRGKTERSRLKNDRGFTLIEVISVLVIMAIVMAVVLSRGIGSDTAKLVAEVDTLKSHLRYAQYLALNDISPVKWGINLGAGTNAKGEYTYQLVKDPLGTGVFTSPYSLPGESGSIHAVSKPFTTEGVVLFDEWGNPTITGSPKIGGQSITITANTGFIP
jgi:prepilin-type N-terminal cleavage/methylation domain-containing protein